MTTSSRYSGAATVIWPEHTDGIDYHYEHAITVVEYTESIGPRTGFRCASSGCAQPCEPVTQPVPAIPVGWQCPVCRQVFAPSVLRCYRCSRHTDRTAA